MTHCLFLIKSEAPRLIFCLVSTLVIGLNGNAQFLNPGCTNQDACNYNIAATSDDGSCLYPLVAGDCLSGSVACSPGMYWNPLEQKCIQLSCDDCPSDSDADGAIGVNDLLSLLSMFGSFCPEGGCTDEAALNFNPNAAFNDGSCAFSPCGIALPGDFCDDGNGLTHHDVVDSSACSCVGTLSVDPDGNGACQGQSVLSYAGTDYHLVEIDNQCWFAENLRTDVYSNGDTISSSNWTEQGAHGIYGGYHLYNGFAVLDERGLCPAGWLVPADDQFTQLELALGMPEGDVTLSHDRGASEATGFKSKARFSWSYSYGGGPGSNESGFGVRASGYGSPEYDGNISFEGALYSRTLVAPGVLYRRTWNNDQFGINRYTEPVQTGQGVRCIKGEVGCTDASATNFNANATTNDGSCEYPALAILPLDGTWCLGDTLDIYWEGGDPGVPVQIILLDAELGGYNIELGTFPNTGWHQWAVAVSDTTINFMWNLNQNLDDSQQPELYAYSSEFELLDCEIYGCNNPEACNFNEEVTSDDGTCLFIDECGECGGAGIPEGVCDCEGNVPDLCGICNGGPLPPVGCTSPDACNFDAAAECDDGTCAYVGDPCDDGLSDTIFDMWGAECNCQGVPYDPVPE